MDPAAALTPTAGPGEVDAQVLLEVRDDAVARVGALLVGALLVGPLFVGALFAVGVELAGAVVFGVVLARAAVVLLLLLLLVVRPPVVGIAPQIEVADEVVDCVTPQRVARARPPVRAGRAPPRAGAGAWATGAASSESASPGPSPSRKSIPSSLASSLSSFV